MSANCIRSLLLQPHPTLPDQSLARHLLPRLLAFVTDTDPDDPERARPLAAHALVGYVGTLSRDHAPVAMALVLPALLARALSEGGQQQQQEEVYRETSGRLLELASADQAAFRGVVGGMSEGQRGFLEEVIRSGRGVDGGRGEERDAEDGERGPSIALKMDFGG
jgi:hypothetical protein